MSIALNIIAGIAALYAVEIFLEDHKESENKIAYRLDIIALVLFAILLITVAHLIR